MQWHHTVLPPIFSLFQMKNYRVTIAAAPPSVLTSLEEEAVPGYIQFTGHPAQGGHNSSWNQVKSTDGEFIIAHLKLDWAYLSTGGLIWLTHQPIHWHIGPKLIQMSQNVLRREGGRNSPWIPLYISSGSDLIPSVSQGFVISSQSAPDLIHFSQIGWEAIELLILDLLHYSSIY